MNTFDLHSTVTRRRTQTITNQVSYEQQIFKHFHLTPRYWSLWYLCTFFTSDEGVGATKNQLTMDAILQLDNNQLIELIKLYMEECEGLRKENFELYHTRDQLLRDQEIVSRENERLLKKLEDVNRYSYSRSVFDCCFDWIFEYAELRARHHLGQLSRPILRLKWIFGRILYRLKRCLK